jgi:hypothetical protein
VNSVDTVVRLDPTGVATQDTWTGSSLDYWAGDLWLGIQPSGGTATGFSADLVEFSTSSWFASDMFGTNQSVPNYSVANFSQTGPNQTTITSDLQTIVAALPSYDACNAWFQGTGTHPSGLQQIQNELAKNSFGHGTIKQDKSLVFEIAAFTGSRNADKTLIPGLPDPAPDFTVNDIGGFFNRIDGEGNLLFFEPGHYRGNTLPGQLGVLIHENAHKIRVLNLQNDNNSGDGEKSNNKLLHKHCRALIEGQKSRA